MLEANFSKILLSINLPWGQVMSHTKFGPDWFIRHDVYWIQAEQNIYKKSVWIFIGGPIFTIALLSLGLGIDS